LDTSNAGVGEAGGKSEQAEVVLSIRDQGPGIPEQELPLIFDRFHSQRSQMNRGGTGLGLSIAKQIADRHGVSITVSSQPEQGTEFVFVLPVARVESRSSAPLVR
jgi:signal transduction histidine kinase